MHFKINMTMLSILVIVVFFNIPFYNNWLNNNLLNPQVAIGEEAKHLDIEGRKTLKYGYSYLVFKDVIAAYKTANISNPLLLLPPDEYLKREHITDFNVVEPCIFYYLTGYKAVWYDSPGVENANCALVPGANRRMVLRKIVDKNDLDQLLATYRKYKLNL